MILANEGGIANGVELAEQRMTLGGVDGLPVGGVAVELQNRRSFGTIIDSAPTVCRNIFHGTVQQDTFSMWVVFSLVIW